MNHLVPMVTRSKEAAQSQLGVLLAGLVVDLLVRLLVVASDALIPTSGRCQYGARR